MKFISSLSLFTLSIGAVSGSAHSRRDLATVQKVLTTISQQVDALDQAVKAFTTDSAPLIAASGTLLTTIKSGTSQVAATSPLTQDDALAIATYVTGLNASVATVVNDLIAQKTALVAACAGEKVLEDLTSQKTESDALAAAITSKVPADLKQLANELSAGIANSLKNGISSFQGVKNGPSCPPPSSGPPPSSSAPASPPSSSAPAQPSDSFSLAPDTPSPTGPAAPALPSSSLGLDLPPVGGSSPNWPPPASAPAGGSSPSGPSGSSGASSPASDSSSSSSLDTSLSSGSSSSGSSGSSSGSSSSGSSSLSSPPKSVSAPPAVYTGGASASQVGTSSLAFVVGCIFLFM